MWDARISTYSSVEYSPPVCYVPRYPPAAAAQKCLTVSPSLLALAVGSFPFLQARTALGGGPACFRNLRHEFLTVLGEGDYMDVPYIVDPSFKEQFEIPQPTAAYAALLELVPAEFVGTSSRLIPLVQTLCAEMVASFEANGLTLPPWRRSQSMLTKWLPSRSRDVCMSRSTIQAPCNSHNGSSSSSTGATCGTNSPDGSSPVAGHATAGGCSPFSRISEHQMCRQGSGRSLLSGRLGSAGSTGTCVSARVGFAPGSSVASSSSASSSTRSMPASVASQVSCGAPPLRAQQLLQQQQQARQSVQQVQQQQQQPQLGAISRQPSLYQGQPPTYTVKMGALAPMPQQQQQQ